MMLFQNYFTKRKHSQTSQLFKFIPTSRIKKSVIIIDSDHLNQKNIESYIQLFKQHSVPKPYIVSYLDNIDTMAEDSMLISLDTKSFDLFGSIKKSKQPLLSEEFDLVVDLSEMNPEITQILVAQLKSSMKISFGSEPIDLFNIVINLSNHSIVRKLNAAFDFLKNSVEGR